MAKVGNFNISYNTSHLLIYLFIILVSSSSSIAESTFPSNDLNLDSVTADPRLTSTIAPDTSESETVNDPEIIIDSNVVIKDITSPDDITEASSTDKTDATTETTTEIPTTQAPTVEPKTNDCPENNNYCLNGGTCVINEIGNMVCICPEEFYGARCQTRNLCKTIIVDSLTGDQICSKIDRPCVIYDRFFRCKCHDDEYFIFIENQSLLTANQEKSREDQNPMSAIHTKTNHKSSLMDFVDSNTFGYSDYQDGDGSPGRSSFHRDLSEGTIKPQTYLAECRKINKCLGVRCKQISEVCDDGSCICNDKIGYLRDPVDGVCKLLNPCLMPTEDGNPICGQAKCVATLNSELYKCICPAGYSSIKIGPHRNTTQCVMLSNAICENPLMNKCQHICRIDQTTNTYKCSCLPGYVSGTKVGYDDHMCFFDESFEHHEYIESVRDSNPFDDHRRPYRQKSADNSNGYVFKTVPRQKILQIEDTQVAAQEKKMVIPYDADGDKLGEKERYHVDESFGGGAPNRTSSRKAMILDDSEIEIKRIPIDKSKSSRQHDIEHSSEYNLKDMSAQDRCNMYCEENKICVLESGSTDSYRCVCDRQGYVSVGDRCLDWCSAAEFTYSVRSLLENFCYSGACKPSSLKPGLSRKALDDPKIAELERKSSWRPEFECDCSSSPFITQDPETKLCKLNFEAIINPCKPGNEGYIDCVENKNAYCAVLYRPDWSFHASLLKDRSTDVGGFIKANNHKTPGDIFGNQSGKKAKENSYVCVCSPEKKFLVDKPRNKARCVDECELLNNECGRFNRMCRSATIDSEESSFKNLIRLDLDDPRMNIKRTGCECLPGFNVGPTETVDFTLDDNNPYATNNPQRTDDYDSVRDHTGQNREVEGMGTKYININSRCLLDYDVVEFHAKFKAPADFDPRWIKILNFVPQNSDSQSVEELEKDQTNHDEDSDKNEKIGARASSHGNINRKVIKSENRPKSDKDSTNSELMYEFQEPSYLKIDISELHKNVVFVAQCEFRSSSLSLEAYQECIIHRYWVMRKMKNHFADWRKVITSHLKETFDLMEGSIRLRVNKCEAILKKVTVTSPDPSGLKNSTITRTTKFDPMDPSAVVDADLACELTLHSASDGTSPRYSRKVLLEKQLQKFIFKKPVGPASDDYYLMAPNMLIRRESFDNLAEHRKLFSPCASDYDYCDKQTKCEMVDTVNFTCTCEYGYTPIGSRDLYIGDSRKEVCEDINECLFDVCKELENVSTCINEIGDYRCQCNRHYTGDNKRYCTHVCNTIPCKHGKCRLVDDHYAFCECDEGYKEADCSVQDPSVALRKANMIICASIFASVLLLAITLAISLNSQLKRTKKKLKRLEASHEAANLFDLPHQQPFRQRLSKASVCS